MMVWTDEKVDLLKSLWIQGKSASEIAVFIGDEISRNAIIGKATASVSRAARRQ